MNFYVGQKVVCVDDRNGGPWNNSYGSGHNMGLREGAVYTVREIKFRFLWLCELHGESSGGWLLRRFRPLIERSTETGMAILRKVADDAAARRNLVRLDQ